MFRNVHKKYIAVNVIVLTAIIAAALVVVNMAVQHLQAEDSRSLLTLILRTGGNPAGAAVQSQRAADAGELVLDTESSDYLRMKTSSYFLVRTAGSVITSTDVRYAYGVTEEEARGVAVLAVEAQKDSGRIGRYAYLRQLGPTGSVYAFLNVSAQLLAQARLLTASVAAGALAEALFLIFVGLMAVKRVRPAEQLLEASRDIMLKSAAGMEAGAAYLISAYRDRGSANASPALREGVVLTGIAADLNGVADAIGRPERPQTVSLSSLLGSMASENSAWFADRDLQVHTALADGVTVQARPEELRALFEILIGNACDNAVAGSSVFLDLLADGPNIGVLVRFEVAELPEAAPDGLFDGEHGHASHFSGGLYAARLLARLNRGELSCEYLDPPALCFTVRFRRSAWTARRQDG